MKVRSFFAPLLGMMMCLGGAPLSCSSVQTELSDDDALAASAPSAAEQKACGGSVVKNGEGVQVVRCTSLPNGGRLQPPADTASSSRSTRYVGIVAANMGDAFWLVDRAGQRYLVVDGARKAVSFLAPTGLPRTLTLPSNRPHFTLYKAAFATLGTAEYEGQSYPAVRLSAARAMYELAGCLIDGRLVGTWEGSLSERRATVHGSGPFASYFDPSKRVPVRVSVVASGARYQKPQLSDASGDPFPDEQQVFELKAKVENYNSAISGSPSFPKLLGRTVAAEVGASLVLGRDGNMHGLTMDGHWVVGTEKVANMTGLAMTGHFGALGSVGSAALEAFVEPKRLRELGWDERVFADHVPYSGSGWELRLRPTVVRAKDSALCGAGS